MLEYVKNMLFITDNTTDIVISNLINAAVLDLQKSGVFEEISNNSMYNLAVTTYVRAYYGERDDRHKLLENYAYQKSFLALTGENVADGED